MEKFQARILNLIRSGRSVADTEFEELALRTYEWQRLNNPIYRRYCASVGVSGPLTRWTRIPALPVSAFKHHRVACFGSRSTKKLFMTSGTTLGRLRGKHPFSDLRFYDAAIRTLTERYLFSGFKRGRRLSIAFLTASTRQNPHSSLSYMGEQIARAHGSPGSFYAFRPDGIDHEGLTRYFERQVLHRSPVLIFTTTFALADHLDTLAHQGIRLRLPSGSLIMETGGYKGRRREVSRKALVGAAVRHLGVPVFRVINEYGMTELSSQFYDRSLRVRKSSSVKEIAPWTRIVISDPGTGRILSEGRTGAIRIYDLANQGSCMAVQTEDMGRLVRGGFEVLGRRTGSPPRGCSLDHENIQ